VVVVPFIDMSAIFGSDASVRGPATHQVFVTGPVEAGARERLDGMLRQELSRWQVLNWEHSSDRFKRSSSRGDHHSTRPT
jgi:hypothetical protein